MRPSAVYGLTARGPKLPRAQADDTARRAMASNCHEIRLNMSVAPKAAHQERPLWLAGGGRYTPKAKHLILLGVPVKKFPM